MIMNSLYYYFTRLFNGDYSSYLKTQLKYENSSSNRIYIIYTPLIFVNHLIYKDY